jgi:hypothetical protein
MKILEYLASQKSGYQKLLWAEGLWASNIESRKRNLLYYVAFASRVAQLRTGVDG